MGSILAATYCAMKLIWLQLKSAITARNSRLNKTLGVNELLNISVIFFPGPTDLRQEQPTPAIPEKRSPGTAGSRYAVAMPVKSEAEIPAGTRQLGRTPIKPPTPLLAQPVEDSGATPETGFALRQAPILQRYLAIISG